MKKHLGRAGFKKTAATQNHTTCMFFFVFCRIEKHAQAKLVYLFAKIMPLQTRLFSTTREALRDLAQSNSFRFVLQGRNQWYPHPTRIRVGPMVILQRHPISYRSTPHQRQQACEIAHPAHLEAILKTASGDPRKKLSKQWQDNYDRQGPGQEERQTRAHWTNSCFSIQVLLNQKFTC